MPPELMKKYIAYARQYVKPQLSHEAAEVIQQFYIELRQNHHGADGTPVTTRQLESLIRLSQARAKLELRQEATAEDANEVIEIMKSSMVDAFSDDIGGIDFNRSLNGSGMSKTSAKKKFVAALEHEAARLNTKILTIEQIKQIAMGLGLDNFFELVTSLNTHGYLIKKSPKIYQLLT